MKDDIEGLRVQMLKEISSLKEDLDRERKAREALEKEVSVSYNQFTILRTLFKVTDLRRRI